MNKRIIILLGIPGSGKGTQAKRIADRLGYVHVSTGDLLRQLVKRDTLSAEDAEMLAHMHEGKLVPDTLIYRLAFEVIDHALDQGAGVVLDGAIRTVVQAQAYDHYIATNHVDTQVMAIEIALTDEEGMQRLSQRKVCAECGFIIPFTPDNQSMATCEKCGGELVTRTDDASDVVRARMEVQGNEALAPLRAYYTDRGVLSTVDGTGDMDTVESLISSLL